MGDLIRIADYRCKECGNRSRLPSIYMKDGKVVLCSRCRRFTSKKHAERVTKALLGGQP